MIVIYTYIWYGIQNDDTSNTSSFIRYFNMMQQLLMFVIDINECQVNKHNCLPSQRCDNTIGSFHCIRFTSCGTGYTLNAQTGQCEGQFCDSSSKVSLIGVYLWRNVTSTGREYMLLPFLSVWCFSFMIKTSFWILHPFQKLFHYHVILLSFNLY
jgi:hypothetical protein